MLQKATYSLLLMLALALQTSASLHPMETFKQLKESYQEKIIDAKLIAAAKNADLKKLHQVLMHPQCNINACTIKGNTALHIVSRDLFKKRDAFDALFILLNSGADIHARNRKGQTPLHLLANKHTRGVDLLLVNGADINMQTVNGDTPLHIAVRKDNVAVVHYLLARGALPSIRNNDGNTPLHLTDRPSIHYIIMLYALLAAGADVNIQNNNGDTPLHVQFQTPSLEPLALYSERKRKIEALLKAGALLNIRNAKGLLACRPDNILLKKYIYRPFRKAIIDGDTVKVQQLIKQGVNLDFAYSSSNRQNTLLKTALMCNNREIVILLLDNGASTYAYGELMASIIEHESDMHVAKLLMEHVPQALMMKTWNTLFAPTWLCVQTKMKQYPKDIRGLFCRYVVMQVILDELYARSAVMYENYRDHLPDFLETKDSRPDAHTICQHHQVWQDQIRHAIFNRPIKLH